ncbi:MAG: hypothetical protein AB7P52_15645 [Alphaproteobacteria bacterium]
MDDDLNLIGSALIDTSGSENLAAVENGSQVSALPAEDSYLILRMDELLPDSGGEVVLMDDVGEGFAIVTHDHVSDQGIADVHITASGLDVNGYSFATFDSGITIFYPSESKLLVLPEST